METWELTNFTPNDEAFIREWVKGTFGTKIERCGGALLISCCEPELEDALVGLCEDNNIECRLL